MMLRHIRLERYANMLDAALYQVLSVSARSA